MPCPSVSALAPGLTSLLWLRFQGDLEGLQVYGFDGWVHWRLDLCVSVCGAVCMFLWLCMFWRLYLYYCLMTSCVSTKSVPDFACDCMCHCRCSHAWAWACVTPFVCMYVYMLVIVSRIRNQLCLCVYVCVYTCWRYNPGAGIRCVCV